MYFITTHMRPREIGHALHQLDGVVKALQDENVRLVHLYAVSVNNDEPDKEKEILEAFHEMGIEWAVKLIPNPPGTYEAQSELYRATNWDDWKP